MGYHKDASFSPGPRGESVHPLALVARLMQSAPDMHDADEVFRWLSDALVQGLNSSVVQCWTAQVQSTGRSQMAVRAVASQKPSLPQQIYLNSQVAAVIERFLQQPRHVVLSPVTNIFSPPHAHILAQYGLHYWGGYLLRSGALFPPHNTGSAAGGIAPSLTLVVSFFTPSPLSQQLLRTIHFLSGQALRVATSRGFLSSVISHPRPAQLSFSDLIPHRAENIEEAQADNPFAGARIISQKKARRLYSAVDGEKTVAELAELTHLEQQEMREALSYLLRQHQIRLHERGGTPVERAAFL